MTDSATNESTQQTNSEQQQQQAASSQQATGATEFRYGDDAPEYLRGKNPQETLAWVNRLVTEVQQLAASQSNANRSTMQPQQLKVPDADLVITDPKAYQQQLTAFLTEQQNATLAAAAAPVYGQLSTFAREMSKNDSANKDIWQKYGSEIDQMVTAVPQHQRTKELYDQAIVMVKGRHLDEISAERAAKIASAGTGVARSGGGSASDDIEESGDVWSKIEATPMGAAALKVAGKKGILAAVRSGAYKSLEEYAGLAAKSRSVVDAANPNVVRSTR